MYTVHRSSTSPDESRRGFLATSSESTPCIPAVLLTFAVVADSRNLPETDREEVATAIHIEPNRHDTLLLMSKITHRTSGDHQPPFPVPNCQVFPIVL
jgi:hypothetical protein